MLFSSLSFLFFFLPCVIIINFLLKEKYRNYFLLCASIFFYAWGEPEFVIIMLGVILFNYLMAIFISKWLRMKKPLLITAICGNLSVLFIFKYLNFTVNNINGLFGTGIELPTVVLPIGISFFTFQAMSYVIDVYRGDVRLQTNPFHLGLYVSFFPQLVAGPIVRYQTIEEQIRKRTITGENFCCGLERFVVGLFKKMIISNNVAIVADYAFANYQGPNASVALVWIGSIAYSLQILFDFSGYSDMAIGMGKMFGFEFLENFNYPYLAKSITDFWRRWHISLSSWFRDYVYIPLGGNRNGKYRQVLNLFVVWCLTGIWHGAAWNYIAWGLIFFVLLVIEKTLNIPSKVEKSRGSAVIYRIVTLLAVNFCWVLFRAPGLTTALDYVKSMIGMGGLPLFNNISLQYAGEFYVFLLLGILCSTKLFYGLDRKLEGNSAYILVKRIALTIMLIWCISYLVIGAHNPFIYFNF